LSEVDHNESTVSAGGADAEDGADPRTDLLPAGTELGRYTIVSLLGEGGMGAVYEGLHRDLKKRVAIKTLHRRLAGSPEVRARFVREGQAASKIRHEHVVDVTDVGVEGDLPYLVMEFLEGENMAALLAREGRLSPERTADLLIPVTLALAAAHASGIVHRDLKPENIFLSGGTTNPKPKVLDFGISKIVDTATANGNQLTGTSAMLGTPFYMSPEQAQDAKGIDARTDQYSLGVIVYEAVAGQRPFANQPLYSLLTKIVEGRFDPPRIAAPDVPDEVEALILKAMAKDPGERFESIAALGGALLRFASDRSRVLYADALGGVAEGAPLPPRVSPNRTPHQSSYAGATSTVSGGSTRQGAQMWLVGGLAAGAVAVAVLAATGGSHTEAPAKPATVSAAPAVSVAPAPVPPPPPAEAPAVPAPVATVVAAAPSASAEPVAPPPVASARAPLHAGAAHPKASGPPKLAPR
jgi:serine/threonine-protein kinase